jgi:hypothetical protein
MTRGAVRSRTGAGAIGEVPSFSFLAGGRGGRGRRPIPAATGPAAGSAPRSVCRGLAR